MEKHPAINGNVLVVLAVLFVLSGCGIHDMGLGALPVYDIPIVQLSEADKTILARWSREAPATFKRIQGAALSYKAILETHNAWALKKNKERLEAMGFTDQDLRRLVTK